MRINENQKEFMEFIWKVEKSKQEEPYKKPKLKNDEDAPLEEKGEIYKILTKQTTEQQIVIDHNSISLQNSRRATQEIAQETTPANLENMSPNQLRELYRASSTSRPIQALEELVGNNTPDGTITSNGTGYYQTANTSPASSVDSLDPFN